MSDGPGAAFWGIWADRAVDDFFGSSRSDIAHAKATGHTVENRVKWPGWQCQDCPERARIWDMPHA